MLIDCHGHTSAPQRLWAYRALLLASRGVDGPNQFGFTDDKIRATLMTLETGRQVGELRPVVESLDFLSAAEHQMILEGNARRVFGLGEM